MVLDYEFDDSELDLTADEIREMQALRLKRIKQRKQDNSNSNYYFLKPKEGGIGIVHKRYWHVHHCLDDQGIRDSRIFLPEGCLEFEESSFNGSKKELQEYGFAYLKKPLWYFDAESRYHPTPRPFPQISFLCDTPEIQDLITNEYLTFLPPQSETLPDDWIKENYFKRIKGFAEQRGLVAIPTYVRDLIKGNVWGGADITLISKELYVALPNYPEKMQSYEIQPL